MREKLIVIQPFGIGDILFISPVVRILDYDIVWPVESHYLWIKDYIKQNNITFIDINQYRMTRHKYDGAVIADSLGAENILRSAGNSLDCMSAKYVYFNCDVDEWRKLYWDRDLDKERRLMELLGINEKIPYNLINQNFAEPRLGYKIDIEIQNDYKNIHMKYIDGYTLLDWGMVIENSKTFHTVSTSTFYMVEFLNCENTELHLYPRYGIDQNLNPIRPIISERWICHE